ncbi:hypothetical protein PPNSA23_41780 [Phyllobacterium phragmitis]|uniref:Transposase n=1 Tax=Phyllobacterium phragmitis TaxID=2670329 RepID=A0ABQ0H5P3_9HYPH
MADLCRKHGILEATFYNWKAKYRGMEVSEAKRLKALEEENARLKKLLAEQMLDAAALRELLAKNVWSAPFVQGDVMVLSNRTLGVKHSDVETTLPGAWLSSRSTLAAA